MVLALGAAAWPLSARGNRTAPFRVAILASGHASDALSVNELRWLREGLEAEGLAAGRDFMLEARYAEGDYSRFKELVRDLLATAPGAITVATIAAAKAAQELTSSVPIVMIGLSDPIGVGLVSSLAKPGGNITGVATMNEDIQLKLFQMVREALPEAKTIAAFLNPNNPTAFSIITALRREAASAGMSIETVEVATPDALDQAFGQLGRHRPDALMLIPDNAISALLDRIVAAAAAQRIPVVGSATELAAAGGFLSYGWVRQEAVRRAAGYLKRIAEGARPSDLPVEQPTKFRLVINRRTAEALGLSIPPTLLVRADEVIE